MKNFLCVLFVAASTFFGSCSKDEEAKVAVVETYSLSVRPLCNLSNITNHCISQEEYDKVKTIVFNETPCKFITFKTTDNVQKSGLFLQVIKGCN